jgi:quercetin dioxygenase-like cupin family protein
MNKITPVDVSRHLFDVHRDLSVSARARKPGPPERIDGMTVGIVTMAHDAPHGGEVHPDGDEILYVISGKVRVLGDSEPDTPVELGPGEACIVPRGEWHRVKIVEPTQLIHMTPGPNGDHRPLQ